ncbi:MAG: NOB1 family endonuclease [Candidatus Nanohalobium sp.]
MHTSEKAVVDANVLIHSRGQIPFRKVFLPPSVEEELKSEMTGLKIQKLDVQLFQPAEESLEKVREKSDEINSPTSRQDEEALALALEKEVPLVTDDKALQNLALHLDARVQGFNTEKVSEKRSWRKVCGNCGKEVSSLPCPRCGSRELDRKRDQRS